MLTQTPLPRTFAVQPTLKKPWITTLYGATRDIVRPVIDEARLLGNLRKGMLEFCVLALLQTEPTYGLDLARRLQSDGPVASESTLYPLLARLHAAGFVESSWQESPAGRPRKYYAITAAGGEAVATFESAWQLLRDAVHRTLRRER